MAVTSRVELGREAFDRRSWREAYELLAAGGAAGRDDLERLAVAAHLVGEDEASAQSVGAGAPRVRSTPVTATGPPAARSGSASRSCSAARWPRAPAGWREPSGSSSEAGPTMRGARLPPRARLPRGAGGGRRGRGAARWPTEIVDIAAAVRRQRPPRARDALRRARRSLALGEIARRPAAARRGMVAVTTGEVSPIPPGSCTAR